MDLLNRSKFSTEKIYHRAQVVDDSFNEDDYTLEVVWSTGMKGRRWNWEIGAYNEELEMSESAVVLDRMNAGAPVLNSHLSGDLKYNLGVVEEAWVKKKEGRAKIKLSRRPENAGYVQDIKDRIIRNISVGYVVQEYKDVSKKNDPIPTLRAVKWEPHEISFLNIPFDYKSQSRSLEANESEKPKGPIFETIITREASVEGEETTTTEASTTTDSATTSTENKTVEQNSESTETRSMTTTDTNTQTSAEAPATSQLEAEKMAERTRGIEIRSICKTAQLDEEFADRMINDGASVVAVREAVIAEMEKRNKQTKTLNNNMGVKDVEQRELRIQLATNALMHRNAPGQVKLIDGASAYRGMTLLRLAEEVLTASGVSTRGMSPMELAQRALQHSSDFVNILANVANNSLRIGYEEAPQTFEPFTRRVQVSDFKPIQRSQMSDAPALEKVNEQGEFKTGKLSDTAETYQLDTFGKIVGVTRKTIINDDVDAFTRVPQSFGRSGRDLEAQLIYKILISNPLMADGKALFSPEHGNLAASGGAIGVGTVSAGRAAMRLQKGLNDMLLNISPKYLLVPAALETAAEQFVGPIVPNQTSQANPFTNKLTPIAEGRLDASSITAWFLIAAKEQIDIFELATLTGQSGPQLFVKEGFDVDGVQWKASYDIGAKAIDHRGLYKNPGA